MKRSFTINRVKKFTVLVLTLTANFITNVYAQLPTSCKGIHKLYYTVYDDASQNLSHPQPIWVYDPSLPYSMANPHFTGITLPANSAGLAVGPNLNATYPPITFYTTIPGSGLQLDPFYYYYNGTAWVSTGHRTGDATGGAVNICHSGTCLYNMDALAGGLVYKYTGAANGAYFNTIVGWGSQAGPYDLQGDCKGSYYVALTTVLSQLRKYNNAGTQVQSWNFTGTANGGGGIVIVDTVLYLDGDGATVGYKGGINPGAATIAMSSFPFFPLNGGYGYNNDDWGACPLGLEDLLANVDTAYYCANGSAIPIIAYGPRPYQWTVINGTATLSSDTAATTFVTLTSDSAKIRLSSVTTCTADTVLIYKVKATIDAGPDHNMPCGVNLDTLQGTLTGTTAGITYSISWAPAATVFSGGTTLNPIVNPITTTLYKMTVTTPANRGGCIWKDSATVFVGTPPTAPAVTSPVNYCKGQTAVPLTATGTNLTWYNQLTGGTAYPSAPTPSTAATGTTNYYVSQTVNGCESSRATIVVNINQPNPPAVTSPIFYCQNDIASSLSATGTGLLWYTTSTGGIGSATSPTPSTSAIGTTNYFVSQTVGGCESDRATISVIVSNTTPAPSVTNINYCQFATASPLTATGTNLKWYDLPTGGTQYPIAPTPSTTTLGTTNYYVSQTLSCGESARVLLAVTIVGKPNPPTVTSPVNYCINTLASPLTATGSNLRWYNQLVAGTQYPSAPTPSTAAYGNTNYFVSQTVSGCESDRATIVVHVDTAAAKPGVSNISYCQNVTALPLTATGTNLSWYTTSSGGTGSSTAPTPSTTAPGSFNFYVSQTVNGCESPRAVITVTVYPQPAPPTANNATYCQGASSVPLTANGSNLLWYTTPSGGPAGTNIPPTPPTTTAGPLTYYVTQTLNNCESQRIPLTITIIAKPAPPTVTSPIVYCQNATSATLTATGSNLRWYDSLTGGTQYPTTPSPYTGASGTFYYYVSQTVNGCESNRATLTVNITASSQFPVVNNYTFCQYENAPQLTATGTNIKWYSTPTGNTQLPAAPTPSTLTPGTFTWYVTQNTTGCESDRKPVIVTVNTKPAPPNINTPLILCQYSVASPLTAGGQNLKWYDAAIGGLGSTLAPTPNTGYEDTLTYWVTQTVNGCESDRSKLEVYIHYKPNGIILSSRSVLCQYDLDTIWYFGNARPDATIDWKLLNHKAVIVQYIGRDTIVVRFDSSGYIPVRMQVDNHGCVSDEFITEVYVRPVPIISITTKPEVCINEYSNIALNFATVNISGFHWNFGGGQVVYEQEKTGPYGIKWPSEGIYIVSVTATANQCTSPPYYDTITVHRLPDAHIAYVTYLDKPTPICSGDSVLITAVTIRDSSYKYLWTPKQYFNGGKGIIDSTQDRVKADIIAPGFVYLNLIDRYGCKGVDSIYFDAQPCCNVVFPDAFTPNGDGKNDIFRMITTGHHKISTFRVVNRWGQTIFETAEESRGWDGTYNGRPQDAGTYFYYLKYQCVNKEYYELKGEVTLIR